jgi:hypothetical protein
MSYEILFSNFVGTQRVVRVKNSVTGEVFDFTPDMLESDELPSDLQQYVKEHLEEINSGDTDYNGLLL